MSEVLHDLSFPAGDAGLAVRCGKTWAATFCNHKHESRLMVGKCERAARNSWHESELARAARDFWVKNIYALRVK
jgi:hypothetical protein